MSAVIQNTNLLAPHGFKLVLARIPHVEYFCQQVFFPEVSLRAFSVPNPLQALNLAATNLEFGQLAVTFKLNEDMNNYMELLQWMKDLSSNKAPSGYSKLLEAKPGSDNGPRSDASLIILDSAMNPNVEFAIQGVFPTGLSNLRFDTTVTDASYLGCNATFSIENFHVKKI